MATLAADKMVDFVERLIAEGNGDYGRLNHILGLIKKGKPLYRSDQNYLNAKLEDEKKPSPKTQQDPLTKINELIMSGQGDTGRLQFILESLQKGKSLYKSDQAYLESKIGSVRMLDDARMQPDPVDTTDVLKSQIAAANQRISNLEKMLQEKMLRLENVQLKPIPAMVRMPGAMPKGWIQPRNDLQEIQQKIQYEQESLERSQTDADKLKIEQSKLMQLILNRKEFEKQLEIEQERLQRQVALERQAVLEQSKLAEQIKTQETELEDAKKERDVIVAQLEKEHYRLADSLGNEKRTLSEVRTEYERINTELKQQESQIAQQIEQERRNLTEQAIVARRIREKTLELETIREEYARITSEAKSKEHELLEQIKMEKARIARHEKLIGQIDLYEKSLHSSRQRQAVLLAKIEKKKLNLQNTLRTVLETKQEQNILDNLIAENDLLDKQISLAEADLRHIQEEKASLEKELKEKKSSITRTKKRESKRTKNLRQKKKLLEKEVKKEATLVRRATKRIGASEP